MAVATYTPLNLQTSGFVERRTQIFLGRITELILRGRRELLADCWMVHSIRLGV